MTRAEGRHPLVTFAGVGAAQGLCYAGTVVWNIILVQRIPVGLFGEFTFAFTCATILALAVGAGSGQAWIRFYSGIALQRANRKLAESIALVLGGAAIACVVLGCIYAYGASRGRYSGFGMADALLVCGLSAAMAVLALCGAVLQARLRPVEAVLISPTAAPVVMSIVFLIAVNGVETGLRELLVLTALSYAIPAVLTLLWVMTSSRRGEDHSHLDSAVATRHQIRYGLHATAIALVYVGITNLDRIMLGIFASPTEVGLYGLAARYAALLYAVVYAMPPIVGPIYARFLNGDTTRAIAAYRASSFLIAAMTLPAAIALIIWSKYVLELGASPVYGNAGGILGVLSLSFLAVAVTGNNGLMLQMGGRQSLELKMSILSLILNIALGCALVPLWGGWGAALSTAASLLLSTAIKTVLCYRIWRAVPAILSNPVLVGSGVLFAVVGLMLERAAGFPPPWAAACALMAYIAVLSPRRLIAAAGELGVVK
jgi:O-antigen/teichoic acid export membrane protein